MSQTSLIEWLFNLRGPSLKWDIDTALAFTRWLGYPHRSFRSVHVGGTNGKGSVAAMLHAIALASDLHSGLFTSPHLITPEERIRVGAEQIDADTFSALIAELRDQAKGALDAEALERHPSFFEMITAAAMLAFERARVDLAVFEVGLGGRLDATNVLMPAVCVITNIGEDHVKTLGGTLLAVAREKAGVIKPGIPVLAGFMDDEPLDELRRIARFRGAPFYSARDELQLHSHRDGSFDLSTPVRDFRGLRCALAGEHQQRNAALAIRCAQLLRARGFKLPDEALVEGLEHVSWPARLEWFSGQPGVLLDAAHNRPGVRALCDALSVRPRPKRRVLVFALTNGRDPAAMIAPLREQIDALVITQPDSPRAQPPQEIAAPIDEQELTVELEPNVVRALERAKQIAGPDGEVLVAGSIYLAGEARAHLLGLDAPGHPKRELAVTDVPMDPPRPSTPTR